MKSDRLVVAAVILVAAGISVLFAYCNGNTGLSFAFPVAGTAMHVDITTTGIPVLVGLPCLVIGAMLLIIAFFVALVSSFRHREVEVVPVDRPRREIPFEE